jgi:two-component system, NtrC family, sensor kinase
LSITYSTLGRTYLALKEQDSALQCLQRSYNYAVKAGYNRYLGSILLNLGRVYLAMGKQETAKEYFSKALTESGKHDYFRGVVAGNLALADIYKQAGKADSSLYHLQNGLSVAYHLNAPDLFLRSYTALADFYKKAGNSDSTVKYQSLIIKINDSLFNSKQLQQFQNIDFNAQQQQQELQTARKDYQNRMQKYLLLGGLAIFLLVAVFLWRSNRHRQKSNALLKRQNEEIEIAMANLKTTQAQLIQSEKMASLGVLTAGIAHEIQNPLNFVNNFSEVNKELLAEMNEEIEKGNFSEVKAISKDVIDNEEKINHHGKRADAIVKGMLQHSRSSNGMKQPTDINALADEYLRLAYHGLRAKDKSFNASMKTDFDESIGNINIIPQDIGRVVLNLINNAFYVVDEKKKQQPNYEPVVTVSTKRLGSPLTGGNEGIIEIRVADNGNGIPQKILDKIFQPFFTTKPTGQGTGLGLSLAYDIVKAHGGELKVETKEREGSVFIIHLPV